jgi:hypothetical protein
MRKFLVTGIFSLLMLGALLFGAASQIVPPSFAAHSAPKLTCDWVSFAVRQVSQPGWICIARAGLSISFVASMLAFAAGLIALLAWIENSKSKIRRWSRYRDTLIFGLVVWIATASGSTLAFRFVNFVLGRLYPAALILPAISVVLCAVLLRLFRGRLSIY